MGELRLNQVQWRFCATICNAGRQDVCNLDYPSANFDSFCFNNESLHFEQMVPRDWKLVECEKGVARRKVLDCGRGRGGPCKVGYVLTLPIIN